MPVLTCPLGCVRKHHPKGILTLSYESSMYEGTRHYCYKWICECKVTLLWKCGLFVWRWCHSTIIVVGGGDGRRRRRPGHWFCLGPIQFLVARGLFISDKVNHDNRPMAFCAIGRQLHGFDPNSTTVTSKGYHYEYFLVIPIWKVRHLWFTSSHGKNSSDSKRVVYWYSRCY